MPTAQLISNSSCGPAQASITTICKPTNFADHDVTTYQDGKRQPIIAAGGLVSADTNVELQPICNGGLQANLPGRNETHRFGNAPFPNSPRHAYDFYEGNQKKEACGLGIDRSWWKNPTAGQGP